MSRFLTLSEEQKKKGESIKGLKKNSHFSLVSSRESRGDEVARARAVAAAQGGYYQTV